jgi:hypothetical protein
MDGSALLQRSEEGVTQTFLIFRKKWEETGTGGPRVQMGSHMP